MAQFCMRVAGCSARVESLFESTPHYFRPYLTEEPPEVTMTVTREDVDFERQFCLEEALQEGFRIRNFPDPYLERAAIQRKFAEYLFPRDVLLFHGSAVALDGVGYLFTARSGTGKSTHTRLWREVFGSRTVMINDDRPFLHICTAGVLCSGSPWSGKHGLDANLTVPLGGICILERGAENQIRSISPEDALPMLRKQTSPPRDPAQLARLEALVDTLAESVPLWHMACNKNPEAAAVSCRAMSAGR